MWVVGSVLTVGDLLQVRLPFILVSRCSFCYQDTSYSLLPLHYMSTFPSHRHRELNPQLLSRAYSRLYVFRRHHPYQYITVLPRSTGYRPFRHRVAPSIVT